MTLDRIKSETKIRNYILLSVFLSVYTLVLTGQNSRYAFSLEYSPHCSKITDNFISEKLKISHNIFLKSEYISNGTIHPVFGIGFLNTGEKETSEIRTLDIEEVIIKHHYNYLLFAFGASIKVQGFYLNPELGVGYNISNKMMTITQYSNGKVEKKYRDEDLFSGEFNSISFPFLLSLGYEFQIGKVGLLSGLKGYYGMNKIVDDSPRKGHYYGFGLFLGIKL